MSNGRDEAGRFLPGHAIPGPGRPPKAQELAVLDAIKTTFTPEMVQEYLKRAMQLAEEQKSARGMVAVLEFAAGYTLGKPIARVEQQPHGLAAIVEMLRDKPEQD